jgi:hypothetical protein
MAFTDHCDVFASFHEDGFNRIVGFVQQQRPSLFNYATAQLAANPQKLCQVINANPIVALRSNPLVTIVDLLPIPGTEFGVDFAAQVSEAKVDFHPGDEFTLPTELGQPLEGQRLALKIKVCGGIACPPDAVIDQFIPPPKTTADPPQDPPPPLKPLPLGEVQCFCLDAFATAGVRFKQYGGIFFLEPFLDGFEIVDIAPAGLESSLECFVQLVLRLSVLPGLRIALETMSFDILQTVINIKLIPVLGDPAVPNNPAIEEDQLKAFIQLEAF